MASVILDFYDEDASSSLLGSLDDSDIESFALRPALFDLGALVFMVPKQVAEDNPTLLRKTNLVRVRFPASSGSTHEWVGVLKDTRSVILSKGEEAGEYVEWTAPGGLFLLSYGALGTASTVSDQPARGSLDDVPARDWIWINEPYGAIITRVIEEGRHSPFPSAAAADSPFEDIDIDFDRVNDSAGNPWATIAEEFRVPIGSNMLDTIAQLATAGDVFLVMDPDLTLHAYQQYSDFAEDRTGGFSAGNVRWQRAINILTELSRQSQAIPATHLIQRDSDGNLSTEIASGYTSGREHYAYAEADSTNDDTTLNKIAQRTIDASAADAEQIAFEIVPGEDSATGEYFPYTYFDVGDLVTLDTGTGSYDFDEASLRIVAFRITLDQASKSDTDAQAYKSLHVVVELAYRPLHTWSAVRSQLGDAGATPGCNCLRFCTPAYPGTGSAHRFYPDNTVVGAISGITPDASWESVSGSPAYRTLKSTPDGDYTATAQSTRSATGLAGGSDQFYFAYALLMDATMAAIIAAGGGYVRGQFRCRTRYGIGINDSAQDMISQIGVRVTQGASTTIRGTALALHSLGSSGGSSKWPHKATKANKQFPPAAASNVLSAVPGAAAGDYLVVEIGARNFTTVTSGGAIGLMTSETVDLPEDDSTESVLNTWIEIGQTGTGATTGCPILDTVAQGAEQSGDSAFAAHVDHQHAHGLISFDGTNYHDISDLQDYVHFAATAPTVSDDEDAGYRPGVHWIDTSTGDVYFASDVTAGAAVWDQINGGGGGGAPTTADYLVGTAQGGLSAEIVVGTTPGGELGGTWASPTVDAVHSGSSHASITTGFVTIAKWGND